jgi:hypothetical protein
MNARLATAIVASIGLALVGCDGGGQARTIHGQINVTDYGLKAPVVLVESSNHLSYVAQVAVNGSFRISVPSGQSYRLTLADGTSAGSLALVSHILWTSKGQNFVWAKVQKGATINFGLIRPMNAPHTSPAAPAPSAGNGQGENDDDQCDEDDDAQGDEQGPSGTPASSCQPPMTPPSNPPVCMPGGSGGMGNSSGDQDDNCDQDNNAQGDDDRDGNGSGAMCGDGGSGDDNNQGDDNAQGNEDEDDGNGSGCVKHVPTCPPAGGTGGSGGGGGGGAGGGGGGAGGGGMAPPDMSTGTGPIG